MVRGRARAEAGRHFGRSANKSGQKCLAAMELGRVQTEAAGLAGEWSVRAERTREALDDTKGSKLAVWKKTGDCLIWVRLWEGTASGETVILEQQFSAGMLQEFYNLQ